MALIKCSECGKEVSDKAKICPHCGFSLEKLFCSECGKEVSADSEICSSCGYPLKKKSVSNIINGGLDKITGAKGGNYVTFKDLFKNTFKKHTEEDMDDVFVCGSKETTPDIKNIDPKKASAWVYLRIFIFFLIAYIPMYIGYVNYNNANFLPGWIMIAAFAVPVTVLIFFFEINLFRNVPLYKVLEYFIIGGVMSLILAILYFDIPFFAKNATTTTYFGAMMIGLIEEVAKAAIVAIFLFRSKKKNYILNGLLIGAAVGAGFAAFETAGYILRYGLNYGLNQMIEVIKLRAVLAPGGHVAWAAIEGAGLMYVAGFEKLNKKHVNDTRFFIICAIPIILHGIWDMPFEFPIYLKQVLLIVAAWFVVIYFINLGLKQIDEAKKLKVNN